MICLVIFDEFCACLLQSSVFWHLIWRVVLPVVVRVLALVVHLVELRRQQVVEMRGELLYGTLISLLRGKLERPPTVHF